METLRLYLEEIEGDWFGWIETFPGAFSQGNSPQEAEQNAVHALGDYLGWLAAFEDAPLRENFYRKGFGVEVVETFRAERDADGYEVNAFFRTDALPPDDAEIETFLRRLDYARADLRKAVAALPPDDWHTAPWGGKSVASILQHLATAEQFYLSRLNLTPSLAPESDPLSLLEATRTAFLQEIREFPVEQRARIFTAQGEKWTLGKVLRRALWHERYHAAQIAVRSNPVEYLRSLAVVDHRWRETGLRPTASASSWYA